MKEAILRQRRELSKILQRWERRSVGAKLQEQSGILESVEGENIADSGHGAYQKIEATLRRKEMSTCPTFTSTCCTVPNVS